jgi:hypothetical protein
MNLNCCCDCQYGNSKEPADTKLELTEGSARLLNIRSPANQLHTRRYPEEHHLQKAPLSPQKLIWTNKKDQKPLLQGHIDWIWDLLNIKMSNQGMDGESLS